MFSTFQEINFGKNMIYPEEIDSTMFNNSNQLKIIFNEKWFNLNETNDSININSNVMTLEFNNCEINESNGKILSKKKSAFSKTQILKISKNLLKSIEILNNFPSLLILNLEILNLGDFLQDQTEWKTEKKENLTINFIDLSNSYRFQNDNYCFFNSLNNSISNFTIYTNSTLKQATCTLKLLEKYVLPLRNNISVNQVCTKYECNYSSIIKEEDKKTEFILFVSLLSVGVLFILTFILVIFLFCKHKSLKYSIKSNVAYELDQVDNFE